MIISYHLKSYIQTIPGKNYLIFKESEKQGERGKAQPVPIEASLQVNQLFFLAVQPHTCKGESTVKKS